MVPKGLTELRGRLRASQMVLAALGCASLATAFLVFFTPMPQAGYERLALPIAMAAADTSRFPAADQLVWSGLHGPFHVYRMAAVLYTHGLDVDVWWYAILVATQFATFLSVWILAAGVARSAFIASVVTAIVASASVYRGTLHWYVFPAPNLVTSTVAMPFAIGAIALAVWRRPGPGLLLASLVFNLHPPVGLVAASAIAIAMIVDRQMPWRRTAAWFGGALLVALPTAAYTAVSAAANFTGATPAGVPSFTELFRLYSDHAYIGDHWREDYGWFVMQLAALIGLRAFLPAPVRRMTMALVLGLIAICVAWLANLYTLDVSAITLIYGMRASAMVKPLAFAALAVAVVCWSHDVDGRARLSRMAAAGLLLIAVLHKNLDIGEGIAAVAWGCVAVLAWPAHRRVAIPVALLLVGAGVVEALAQGWGILGIAPFGAAAVDAARAATIGASFAFLAFVLAVKAPAPHARSQVADVGLVSGGERHWGRALVACAATLVLALVLRGRPSSMMPASTATIASALRISEPPPDASALMAWANTQTPVATLFAIPPADPRLATFRLAAGRGVYMTLADVNQLAFDAANFGIAHERLLKQGMQVLGRHSFDMAPWDTIPAARVAALSAEGVDFAVFHSELRSGRPLPFREAYRDDQWVAYDLRTRP